jgi:cysteinyl-tRNA synthetase
LILTNSLTRKKELFVPIDPRRIGMYVCGPTVYDRAHIGNARPVVVFDVLARLLRTLYPAVIYVRNITDVDDKINARAKDNNEPIAALTARTARDFHEDIGALGALPPDVEPFATAHIGQMIAMIEILIGKGHAYAAEGHVLFSVPSMPDYGRLSGRSVDEMIAGARVEVAPYKQNPADFVLWKPSPGDLPGWESPWGRGRPGWHIECSAMSKDYLGVTFDIHGGGHDLIFPHHENEIAQSSCAHDGQPLARYWLHNGHVTIAAEKMSKSVGNVLTVRSLLDVAPGEAIRFALLSTHYRQPMDWTDDSLKQAKIALDRFYLALRAVADVAAAPLSGEYSEVQAALEDDLNTPLAIAHLHDLAGALNRAKGEDEQSRRKAELLAGARLLGLLRSQPDTWLHWSPGAHAAAASDAVSDLIRRRIEARKAKNWAEADSIRDELTRQGVAIEDGPTGTTWRRI